MLFLTLITIYIIVIIYTSRSKNPEFGEMHLDHPTVGSADSLHIKTNSPDKLWKYKIENHPISQFNNRRTKSGKDVTWGRAGSAK